MKSAFLLEWSLAREHNGGRASRARTACGALSHSPSAYFGQKGEILQ